MGSIRGRVRLHVPKDRRAVREKVYGGSNGQKQLLLLLRLDCHFLLPLHKRSCLPHIASFLWFLNIPGLTLCLLMSVDRFLFWLLID